MSNTACNAETEGDESLDPRIKEELERLNGATDEINRLEKELDEARSLFRQTLSDSSTQLNVLLKKHKKSIEKSRDYYQTLAQARKIQSETQHAVVQFRRASSFYKAAKETISLAEQRLAEDGVNFDEAWQEMLNHSTIKMMDAEKEKMRSELEHHRKSQKYQELEHKIHRLEKSQRRNIAVAKPYYELKTLLEVQLEQQKQNVDDLQKGVSASKTKYKTAMLQLEKISEEIHENRKLLALPVREPGVGCESDEDFPLEINLEKHLDFEGSVSDDCISTDTSSMCSYDSNSLTNPDCTSINSIGYDSAICSPKSLTLERVCNDPPNAMDNNNIDIEDVTLRLQKTCSTMAASQISTDTLIDDESSDDDSIRDRAATITADPPTNEL